MPNHVRTLVSFGGDPVEIEAVLESIAVLDPGPRLNAEGRQALCSARGRALTSGNVADWLQAEPAVEAELLATPGMAEPTPRTEDGRLNWGPGTVDFRRVVPEPDGIEQGGCTGEHGPGVVCWYRWNLANWGTKWNAYDQAPDDDHDLCFSTAWSVAAPVFEALSKQHPDLTITVEYADEDLGSNVGRVVFWYGELVEARLPRPGCVEAYDMAAAIRHVDLAGSGYVKDEAADTYRWTEPDEKEG